MKFLEYGFKLALKLINEAWDQIIPGIWLYSLPGVVAGIVVVVLAGRKSANPGKDKKLYKALIFIVLSVFSTTILATIELKSYTIQETRKTFVRMTQLVFPSYQYFLVENRHRIDQEQISFEETVKEFAAKIQSTSNPSTYIDRQKEALANHIAPQMVEWGITELVGKVAAINASGNGTTARSPLETAKVLNVYKYNNMFWEEIEDVIIGKIRFRFFILFIILSFSLLTLIIIPAYKLFLN